MTLTVTPKQLEILIFLYRFRFLDRLQIQTLLHHKDPRRVNSWLKELTSKKIIGRHYSKKLKENTKLAIYYLAPKSKELLKNQDGVNEGLLKRSDRERLRSRQMIDHCLLLARYYLKIGKSIKDETIHFFTKTDLITRNYLPSILPDAYIVREHGEAISGYFLEIIDEKLPRFMIRKRIKTFVEYHRNSTWRKELNHTFPMILILCPNNSVKTFLQKYCTQVLEEDRLAINFCFSTIDEI